MLPKRAGNRLSRSGANTYYIPSLTKNARIEQCQTGQTIGVRVFDKLDKLAKRPATTFWPDRSAISRSLIHWISWRRERSTFPIWAIRSAIIQKLLEIFDADREMKSQLSDRLRSHDWKQFPCAAAKGIKVESKGGVDDRGDASYIREFDWDSPRPLANLPGTKTRAVQGHEFGLDLSEDERKALVTFLRTL